MRLFALFVVSGCSVNSVGDSGGTLTLIDPETSESFRVDFDGGALAWNDQDGHHIAITNLGINFHCDYARVHLAYQAGRDIDRRRSHFDLVWNDGWPGSAVVIETNEGLLGAGSSGRFFDVPVEMDFVDEGRLSGTLRSGAEWVAFDAEDCGAF